MAVYDKNGNALNSVYDKSGDLLQTVYDKDGNIISGAVSPYVYGTSYAFADMEYTDESSVSEISALHTRNGSKTIKYNPQVCGNATTTDAEREWLVFTCNIATNGNMAGLWIYTPVDSLPCYGGKTKHHEGLTRLKIKLNNTSATWLDLRPGFSFYMFSSPPEIITSISVSAIHGINATLLESSMYLDSIEVGFHARRAHVMFNLDCVPSNFMAVGYPLFEEFGLKCTLQYHISNDDSTMGADSTYLDAALHERLVEEGYEYATYSGWKSYETRQSGDVTPMYDNETYQSLFEAHAERMWKVNNDSGIFAPSCIHGTGYLWGPVYNNACRNYPFLMIRRGCNRTSTSVCMAYYDPEYRVMEPYFLEGCWTASSVSTIKSRIEYAIRTKQAIQVGCHQIMPADYDTSQSGSGIYVNETAIRELLSYVKGKVNAGEIICCTAAEYVAEMEPTVYADWLEYRQPQVS